MRKDKSFIYSFHMSNDDTEQFIADDDDFPEPGPDAADHLFHDKYGVVWHCLYIEDLGWAWEQVGDSHE